VPLGQDAWGDTSVDVGAITGPLINVFTGERVPVEAGKIRLSAAFNRFPAALLVAAP
jgi:hypothetical protein